MNLAELYQAAWEDDVFFVEYAGGMTAAGDARDLDALAEEADKDAEEILKELPKALGLVVDLCFPGPLQGEDRVANCQAAWDAFKPLRAKGDYPRTKLARDKAGMETPVTKRLGTF